MAVAQAVISPSFSGYVKSILSYPSIPSYVFIG